MRKPVVLIVPLGLLLAAAPSRATGPHGPFAIGKQVVVSGADFPAAFTITVSGKIYYGERFTGEIRTFSQQTGNDLHFFTIPDVVTNGEQGLLGIDLHPLFPDKPFVYAYATRDVNGSLRNQIVRIENAGGEGTHMRVIWSSDTVAGAYHDGGRILFGPDRKLYAVVGEGHSPANAQNLDNEAGKVLRMNGVGGVPPDNPFPGSRIFSYGLRNSFGFNFDPETGLMWETENGPECNDELNIVRAAENHAWGPNETCSTPPPPPANTNQDGPQPRIMPLRFFTPTIAPTGTAFCSGCGLANSEGRMFFGAWNTGAIRRVALTEDRMGISSMRVVYTNASGVLSIEAAPDGRLYFSDAGAIYRLIET